MKNEKQTKKSKLRNYELIKHQSLRYLIFGTIYLHQGFIQAFMLIYLSLYMLSYGVSILFIGLTITLGAAPWIIKVFYGILSDRKGSKRWGRRIPYMLIGTFFSAILFFTLIPINPLTINRRFLADNRGRQKYVLPSQPLFMEQKL